MTVMNDFNDTMTFALLTIQFYSVIGLILPDNAMLSHILLATLILPRHSTAVARGLNVA